MVESAAKLVTLRYQFYKDSYYRVLFIFLLSLILNAGLVFILFYQYTHPPKPLYFPTSVSGRITPLYPLSRPNQPDYAVLQWVNSAIVAAFSYNYVNYKQELEAASEFFTPEGWKNFTSVLRKSNNLEAVSARNYVVSAEATAAPNIVFRGRIGGRYAWRIEMPIRVTYQNMRTQATENYLIRVTVVRVSSLNSPRGIGIAQFVATPKYPASPTGGGA